MKPYFDHEKLHAYQQSLAFIRWLNPILERIPKNLAVWGQLDRASTSSPLNIAEGNGKFTPPDRCKYFDIARGSALESAAALDVLVAQGHLTEPEIVAGKQTLQNVVSTLVGLIKSNSPDRLYEEPVKYQVDSKG